MSTQKVIKISTFKKKKKENLWSTWCTSESTEPEKKNTIAHEKKEIFLNINERKVAIALKILGGDLKSLSVTDLKLAGEIVDKSNGVVLLTVSKKTGIKTIPRMFSPYPRLAWMYLYMLFTKAVSWKTPREIEEAFPFSEHIDNDLSYMSLNELHRAYGKDNFDGSIYKAQDFMFDFQNELLTAISFSFFVQLRGLSEYPSSIIESKAFPKDMRDFLHIYQEFANNDVVTFEDSEEVKNKKREKEAQKKENSAKLHPIH
jgi:hypothetical protein